MATDRSKKGGYAYLVHLDAPLCATTGKEVKQAQHYIGAAGNLHGRIERHAVGQGSRFLAEANRRGITWRVVRHWRFSARYAAFAFEKALKARKRAADLCPVCRAQRGLAPATPTGGPLPEGKAGRRGILTRQRRTSPPTP